MGRSTDSPPRSVQRVRVRPQPLLHESQTHRPAPAPVLTRDGLVHLRRGALPAYAGGLFDGPGVVLGATRMLQGGPAGRGGAPQPPSSA